MKTAPQIVFDAAGQLCPDATEHDEPVRCWVCGGLSTRTVAARKWVGGNFTSHAQCRAPHSDRVCEACVFVCSRTSPVLGRPVGKCQLCDGGGVVLRVPKSGKGRHAKVGDECPKCEGSGMATSGGNFRNYCHLWAEGWEAPPFGPDGARGGNYANASKGEKPLVREFLRAEKHGAWFAAIADSAQKHVLPWAPINYGPRGGVLLMDESHVHIPERPDALAILDDLEALLTAGGTKEEVERGEYTPRAYTIARAEVLSFESRWAYLRGSAWFAFVVWVSQRDEVAVSARIEAEKAAAKEKAARAKAPRSAKTKRAKSPRKVKDADRGAEGAATDRDGGGDAGDARGVPAHAGSEAKEELGDPPGTREVRSSDGGQRGGVGKQAAKRAAHPESPQLKLEGFD